MKEIFLGFFFHKEKEDELLKICKNGISIAVNQYQEGFLKGRPRLRLRRGQWWSGVVVGRREEERIARRRSLRVVARARVKIAVDG